MGRALPRSRTTLVLLSALLAVLALALHLPGEVSFDSSVQLLEAKTGVSRSWNPPFMSALLQLFGGGTNAMACFVIACTLLTYGGLALAIGPAERGPRTHKLRVALYMLLLANPVIVLYVGIVWKDVLFAALLCFACGASIAATHTASTGSRCAFLLAVSAAACLLVAAHVRQQGLFLVPALILCPWFALAGNRRPAAWATAAWVAAACILFIALGAWTDSRIAHQEGHDRERGIRRMLTFDILGTAAIAGQPILGTEATQDQISRAYSPARIDTLSSVPALGGHFRKMTKADLRNLWLQTVSDNPSAFARHRIAVAAKVFNLKDLDQCLPMHVGIDGNASVLAQVGLQAGADARDQWMYALSLPLRSTPWFRHYATLVGLCVLVVCAWPRRRSPTARIVLWFSLCMAGYALFTAALAIACDFRYLYPAVVVASACALGLLTHEPRGARRSSGVR